MFKFEGVDDANLLHCTHRYFADDSGVSRDQVITVLRNYFSAKPFQPFVVPFTKLTPEFGKDGTYRVVEPESNKHFLLDLKKLLDTLAPDAWPDYRPHTTVGRNTDEIVKPIVDYVLMDDHVEVWSAVKQMAMLEAEVRSHFSFQKKK